MKKLPYQPQAGSSNDLCAIYCMANIFNDPEFLMPEIIEGWSGRGGMLLNEENALLNCMNGFAIEDLVKNQYGLSVEVLNHYLEPPTSEDSVYVYLFNYYKKTQLDNPVIVEAGRAIQSHRMAIAYTKDYTYVIDINSLIWKATGNFSILSLTGTHNIVSISYFVYDRKPVIFTKEQMSHILW